MERAARLIKKNQYSKELLNDDELARAIWPTAVGKAIASHTSRPRLVREKLIVEVEDAIWQKQLHFLTYQILDRLRVVSGVDLIKDIEFRIGVPRRQPARAEIRDTLFRPRGNEMDEAERIEDPVLKKVYRMSRKKATA